MRLRHIDHAEPQGTELPNGSIVQTGPGSVGRSGWVRENRVNTVREKTATTPDGIGTAL